MGICASRPADSDVAVGIVAKGNHNCNNNNAIDEGLANCRRSSVSISSASLTSSVIAETPVEPHAHAGHKAARTAQFALAKFASNAVSDAAQASQETFFVQPPTVTVLSQDRSNPLLAAPEPFATTRLVTNNGGCLEGAGSLSSTRMSLRPAPPALRPLPNDDELMSDSSSSRNNSLALSGSRRQFARSPRTVCFSHSVVLFTELPPAPPSSPAVMTLAPQSSLESRATRRALQKALRAVADQQLDSLLRKERMDADDIDAFVDLTGCMAEADGDASPQLLSVADGRMLTFQNHENNEIILTGLTDDDRDEKDRTIPHRPRLTPSTQVGDEEVAQFEVSELIDDCAHEMHKARRPHTPTRDPQCSMHLPKSPKRKVQTV